MPEPLVRAATVADAANIADIYNHYIRTSTATFDTIEKSAEERTDWLTERDSRHPVLVATIGSEIVGWAALSPWSQRPAYSRTVEVATYVSDGSRGRGVGPMLLAALVERAVEAGHHALIAQIVDGNTASLRMAERAGFERVGVLREVGWKFERWLDVVLLERVLQEQA